MMKFDTKTASPLPSTTDTSKSNPNCCLASTATSTVAASAATPAKMKPRLEDAALYIHQIKTEFEDRPHKLKEFLDILKTFKSQQIDITGVIRRVSNLFQGNPRLILDFSTFLPDRYKIKLPLDGDGPSVAIFRTPESTATHVLSISSPGPLKFNTKTASHFPCTTETSKSNPNCYLQVNSYIRCEQMPVAATAAAPVATAAAPVTAAAAAATVAAATATATATATVAVAANATAVAAIAANAAAVATIIAAANKKKEQETAPVSPKSVLFETNVGRFEQSFYSPKSHCQVTVKRSCRLAELGTK
jgi:histone deacetylase complex regulatory component SIN3